jgi:hypothetical protein
MTHDRFGEQLDNSTEQPHDPRCRRGWLGEDIDGRPVPCIICRPHLFRTKVPR